MSVYRLAGILSVLLPLLGVASAEVAGGNSEERIGTPKLYRLEDGIAEHGRLVLDMPHPADAYVAPGALPSPRPSGYPTSYVAVRMLFPSRAQLKAILESRGEEQETSSNRDLLEIRDFEVERCQVIAGPDGKATWSRWRPVSLRETLRLLDLVPAFDSEQLPPNVIEPTITMPLPLPKYGFWGPDSGHATHPRLADLRWADADRDRLDAIRKALLKVNRELEERRRSGGRPNSDARRPAERGWSRSLDIETLLARLSRDPRANLAAWKAIRKESETNGGEPFNLDEFLRTPEFSLFRYVDFDIEPGRAYCYRARLKLSNPNFGLPVERVVHPGVAADEFRVTEWSEPTPPAVVPPNVEFYVRSVDAGTRYRPEQAKIRVHVWSRDVGTWIAEDVDVQVGERVSGTEPIRTDVADLVRDDYREQRHVRLVTKEVVADLLPVPGLDLDGEIHGAHLGDLDLRRLEWSPLTLVVDETGAAVHIDPAARMREARYAEQRYEAQMSALKSVLSKPKRERFGE